MLVEKLFNNITRSQTQKSFVAKIQQISDTYCKQVDGLRALEATNGVKALRAGIQDYLDTPNDQTSANLLNLTASNANLSAVIRDAKHQATARADDKLVKLHDQAVKVMAEVKASIEEKCEKAISKARKAALEDGIDFDASGIEAAYREQIDALPNERYRHDNPAAFVRQAAQVMGVDPKGADIAPRKTA